MSRELIHPAHPQQASSPEPHRTPAPSSPVPAQRPRRIRKPNSMLSSDTWDLSSLVENSPTLSSKQVAELCSIDSRDSQVTHYPTAQSESTPKEKMRLKSLTRTKEKPRSESLTRLVSQEEGVRSMRSKRNADISLRHLSHRLAPREGDK